MFAIGVVAGFVSWTFPGWRPVLDGKTWLDVATAIGTVGAAAAAVWLGLREGHWRVQSENEQAKIVHAVVVTNLGRLLPEVYRIHGILRSPLTVEYQEKVKEIAVSLELKSVETFLDRLNVLPGDEGVLMAELWAVVPGLVDRVLGLKRRDEVGPLGSKWETDIRKIQQDVALISHHARILLRDEKHLFLYGLGAAANSYKPGERGRGLTPF